jgi:type II secretory pathway pseudopilin PulG
MGMQHKNQRGFTIIEVMLFLAVSGALAVGILAGSGVAITQQRYRDSVNSLQTLLRQQYNETDHVINDRDKDRNCKNAVISTSNGPAEARGTSECVIIGKYVTITNGTVITISSVVGQARAGTSINDASNDFEALKQYDLGISTADTDVSDVAWGASIRNVSDTNDQKNLAFLILRSPLTGSLRTFSGSIPSASESIATLVSEANSAEKKICVDSASIVAGPTLGVVVRANAASASAVELLGVDGGC